MNSIYKGISLTFLCIALTFLLFGFIVFNHEHLEGEFGGYEPPMIGCGTIALERERGIADEYPGTEYGKLIFDSNCKACHRLHQKVVGPALAGVFDRAPDSVWIRKMIRNADKLIASGDAYAVQVWKEYGMLQHTAFDQMPEKDLDELMKYLKAASTATIVVP